MISAKGPKFRTGSNYVANHGLVIQPCVLKLTPKFSWQSLGLGCLGFGSLYVAFNPFGFGVCLDLVSWVVS